MRTTTAAKRTITKHAKAPVKPGKTGATIERRLKATRAERNEARAQQVATAEILNIINRSSGDPAPVFDAILERAMRLCDAAFGGLLVPDGEFIKYLTFHNVPERFANFLTHNQVRPRTLFGPSWDTGAAINIADLSQSDAYRRRLPITVSAVEDGGIRATLLVPLMKDGAFIGAFTIYRQEARPFTERQTAMAQSFAAQAAIAMENARLMTATREALEKQTATAEILRVISGSPTDLQPTFDAIAARAMRLSGSVTSVVFRFDGSLIHIGALYGMTEADIDAVRAVFPLSPSRDSATARAILTRDIVHIPDPTIDSDFAHTSLRQFGTILSIPMLRDGEPFGAITVTRQRVEPFASAQIDLLKTFADQAVIAIENVRLFNELRARTDDLQQSLEYQTATSDVLKVISRSTFDLTPVLQYVLDTAMRLCRAAQGSIFRLDGTEYRWAVGQGLDPAYEEIERTTPIVVGEGTIVGRAASRRQTVQILDAWHDPLYAAKDDAHITIARTMLGVPLLREGVPVGVIAMARKVVEPFKDKEIELVTTFADQAVIAIENARLLTELRESLGQQQAIAEVLQVINSSPGNLAPVYDAMLEKAASLCDAKLGFLCSFDGEVQILLASRGASPEVMQMARRVPIEPTSSVGRLARSQYEFIHTPDITDDPVYQSGASSRRLFADAAGARTALWVALRKDGVLIGVFILYRTEVRPFTDKQIALLQSFAAQAVIAMDNARLLNEIRQRQAELRVTFDNMGDAVIMFDGEQRLVAWNRNFLHMLDVPEEWLATPRSYGDFTAYLTERGEFGDTPPPDIAAPSEGEVRSIRYERERPNGRVLEVRRNPIPGAAGFVFIYSDITERKLAEQSILAAREAAERALADLKLAQANLVQAEKMASLGQLTAGIAHEIKNPLNFVNNFANLSNELLGELKETAAPAFATLDADKRDEIDETLAMLTGNLEKIQQHGRRADGIVKSMLAHSRGGSGDRREADVNALVEESLNLAYHGARAQDQNFNITLERDYDKAMKPIELVPQDVTRVFLNLCGNGFYAANKRRKEGGKADFRPVLKVATKELGDAVEVRIRDNGTGIPPDVRDRLFQPFFTTKPTGEGTGLGLSISYDIVTQQHGGTIAVDSRVGDFTEFTVRLPRKR